jgi:hypothetical protein
MHGRAVRAMMAGRALGLMTATAGLFGVSACNAISGVGDFRFAPDGGGEQQCSDVDMMTSALHCGGCRRSCHGGECVGGVCQPVTIAQEESSPIGGIAVYGQNVYWTTADSVMTAPINDPDVGAVKKLASCACGEGLAVDKENVYWTSPGDHCVKEMPLAGDTPTTLSTGQFNPVNIAVNTKEVYWTNDTSRTVGKAQIGTTNTSADFVTEPRSPAGIAVDDTSVYWTISEPRGTVRTRAIDGDSTIDIASEQNNPTDIVVDGANVYWTNRGTMGTGDGTGDGTVMSAPVTGGSFTQLASNQSAPGSIAVYGGHVYWTNMAGGTVMKLPINGGTAIPIASNQDKPHDIAVDESNVYWTNDGNHRVMRVAR